MAEQQNSNFPSSSSGQGDSDLLAQIAAGDAEEEKKARVKSSFVMNFMTNYMRLTLILDAKRRQYQKVFRILDGIWAVLMTLLYAFGLIMLLILIVSYMRFPTEIQNYLKVNGVICDDMKIPGYVISQVDLKGLHDKDNTYRIDSLSISSTFADFLNRRARSVSAKGVHFTIDPDAKGSSNPMVLLARLNQGGQGKTGLRIDTLEVSNATVTLKGKDYTLPLSLSLTGIYGNETNINAFITVDEPNLKVSGPLTVRSEKGDLVWDFNISSGKIAFPGRPLEKMTGKIGFKTNRRSLHSLTTDLSVFVNQARRDIKLNLNKKKDLFSGLFSLKWVDMTNASKPVERTKLDFDLSGVNISLDGSVQSKEPIQLSLTSTYSPNLKITDLTGEFSGQLNCRLFDTCSYQLDKPVTLLARKITVQATGYDPHTASRFKLMLNPSKKFADVSFKTGQINFDLTAKDFVFDEDKIDSKNEVSLKANKSSLAGFFNLWDRNARASLLLDNFTYQTPVVKIEKGHLETANIFDDNAALHLTSPNVMMKNSTSVKVPFALTYKREKGLSDMALLLENKQVQVIFGGTFDWLSGSLNGQLIVPTINLGALKQPLHRISDLIPDTFIKTTGKIAGYGRVSGNLYSGVKGPFYLSLMDFGFETEQLKIKHLNTALVASSVLPFVTEPEQKIYIGEISSFIPISNVDVTLKAEDNYAQIRGLSADVAGMRLSAGETIVPYKNIGTLIYLRNQNEDLTKAVNAINLKDWKNTGSVRGNILFPIEIKDMSLNIRNAVLQLFGAELQYAGDGKNKPAFLGKNNKMSISSGSVTIDSSEQKDENKVSLLLYTVLHPSGLKKTIRETVSGKLSDIATFKTAPTYYVPPDVSSKINHIHGLVDKYRVR